MWGYLELFLLNQVFSWVFFCRAIPCFTSGLLVYKGILNFEILAIVTFLAAILGDSFGYAFGRRVGPAIFKKEDSILFHKDHLERAKKFYEKHGGKAIILARFMPIIRTFAPILAGVGGMKYSRFIFFNVVGAFLWSLGLITLGYYLGALIPNIEYFILPIIALIILASISPTIIALIKNENYRREGWKQIKDFYLKVRNRKKNNQ